MLLVMLLRPLAQSPFGDCELSLAAIADPARRCEIPNRVVTAPNKRHDVIQMEIRWELDAAVGTASSVAIEEPDHVTLSHREALNSGYAASSTRIHRARYFWVSRPPIAIVRKLQFRRHRCSTCPIRFAHLLPVGVTPSSGALPILLGIHAVVRRVIVPSAETARGNDISTSVFVAPFDYARRELCASRPTHPRVVLLAETTAARLARTSLDGTSGVLSRLHGSPPIGLVDLWVRPRVECYQHSSGLLPSYDQEPTTT